ncbi:PREDICTED: zinc finger protein 3 homolog isoform X1 [Dufourea novaeangliae]|uniref:zinc finger protein 3 homolog isoform X1 n=1 Tax=Dufourea novaeangliae TaxID=178035 RepID=UPI0007676A89|nr:PREDICTED: zinc finger protein 3 homolog isoform X1 [Dufourea novaeangliae]
MSSLDYLDLCRLCLVKDRVSVPIFDGEGDVRQIFLKIAACLPVKVEREDKLPKKICDDCVYKVELFYQFWNTTANAEKQLLQWLGEVGGEGGGKQGYVSNALNPNVMKQEQSTENRLDGNVMQQVSEHQNNMGMGMMDNMGLGIPMMLPNTNQQQQITSVPMDTSGSSAQTVQAVPGPSSQTTHNQISQNQTSSTQQEDEEESSEDEENSDDECDGDEGLPVKEESEEDPNSRTIEPTTFVNVSLACDEAGPSGLQQQKIADMPEMPMPQSTDGDPKTGFELESLSSRGIFIYDKESVVMKKWQILEFDGKPYYAFVPEGDAPLPEDDIPEEFEESGHKVEKQDFVKVECLYNEDELQYDSTDEKLYDEEHLLNGSIEQREDEEEDVKPIILNGSLEGDNDNIGDLYQVKVQGSMVTIEKLTSGETDEKNIDYQQETEDQEIYAEQLEQLEQIDDLEQGDQSDQIEQVEYLEEDILEAANNHMMPARTRRKISRNSGGALKCKVCSEMFSSAISFRKHVAWTHKKKVCIQEDGAYICAVCDYRTLKKSLFAAHLERKHETWSRKRPNNMLFPCATCGFVCRSKHSLQSHFIRKHTDRYEHQCKFCSKKFKVKGDLTNHVRFHHKEKPINCDVCGKLCQNSGSLYVHQKWAHYKPKYECHICKRRMVTQENLDQHLLTQHEKREKIVCAECGKTFTKKDSFKRHMAVHTGCKPHSCLICNKPFARRSQLRQHLLIHTGKRPFVCDICGKAFTQKPGLICHRKTHPGPHPPLPVMPIADIVKEFTEGYVQEISAREHEERIEEEA